VRPSTVRPAALAGVVLLAALLWGFTFALPWGNFWVKISISASLLAILSLMIDPGGLRPLRFEARDLLLGLVSAAALYLVFWAGKSVSVRIFSFAGPQIGAMYEKGGGTPAWVIGLLLFWITGPSEEIFWRGFLQRHLSERLGGRPGWLAATAVYAGVHVWSGNFMLIGAAGVAGLFWGALYRRLGSLPPVIVSQSLWSTVIFTLAPFP